MRYLIIAHLFVALEVAALLWAFGCADQSTQPPADECAVCATCPPKRRCLFDSTANAYIVLPK